MSKLQRKVPETLDFVKGLLISADEIPKALTGKLEPRKVLAQNHTNISNFNPEEIQDLGKYQGRVVLVALAAELALKFAWETENQGAAPGNHNLLRCFCRLSSNLKEEIRSEYRRRVPDPIGQEWKTVDQTFTIYRDSFVDWRYIVEEGKYPSYIMRATYLKEATLSVVHVVDRREDGGV